MNQSYNFQKLEEMIMLKICIRYYGNGQGLNGVVV